MIPMEMQTHDHLVELFTKLVGAAGLAPTVCGTIGPRELFANLLRCAPFLGDTHVRPEDGLAQVETLTFDMAWSVFSNGRESVAIFILTRFEGNFSMELLRTVINPFKEMTNASGLKSSIASQGSADEDVVAAMRGAQSVPMDLLLSGGDIRPPATSFVPDHAEPVTAGPRLASVPTLDHAAPPRPPVTPPPPPPPPPAAPPQAPPMAPPPEFTPANPMAHPPASPVARPPIRRAPAVPTLEGQLLTRGANTALPPDAQSAALVVELGWFTSVDDVELDASAILLDHTGRVAADEDFVFFNNPRSPDGAVALDPQRRLDSLGYAVTTVSVSLDRLAGHVHSIVFPVSIYEPEQRGHSFGLVHTAFARIAVGSPRQPVATFVIDNLPDATESAMVFCEIYRRNDMWKIRAIGQGYASGLAGIATDYGVDVG